ncbi:MAG: PSD1 and planctomycete cytochrome C domain-containing protein [Cyclobacteriaceae bacterium]|nr:PSD1 and planctomycete cytochrome C domain-containing protein [Cyclobacteriaceae bacterium]MDH4297030.1 PSD1 and planctomycete cytochrome C domain-containing protein [Cyclobacteriaceae bacterium]MDH5250650.1 PSD1 and planctomycete cytochrome C domain-containing protein [Cyclobacteriaceae bacterium]
MRRITRFTNITFFIFGLLGWSCKEKSITARLTDSVDYNLDIRPILSDRCFKCHGPDANQRKANLRLDTHEGALAALKDDPTGHAITPGHPETSEVFIRISSPDTAVVMPPVKSNLSLNESEIELIEKWIAQGARYKPHWAFIRPKASPIPEVTNATWPINEIDYFILDQMERSGFEPNKSADKERILKRVSFALTGLPPSVELQEEFLLDNSAGAYEKIVDELLAQPAYGEKMATYWLDVARYADSHGYQDDGLRTMWPWRDWVIHAFNENYPYDSFVTWQLAGDILPNATPEQLLATGFNRNHKITQEGGVIDEEYRIEYVTDRTNTFGKAFLALTFECAKCHDHKYDPILQKDYYSVFAFFNQVPEKGLVGDISLASLADPPKMKITTEDVSKILTFINKKDTTAVEVMVMKDAPIRRPTYLLKRGVYDAPDERVHIGLPSAIMPFDSVTYGNNRLGLAKWLVDKKNPLTARVFVNRMWQELFGRGIVKTSGDFGMQGEMPSHPALLDWLALDFMDHEWDVKRLLKKIVMSATYRQSSELTEEKKAADPENILLTRGPRTRMAAETIRDMALASSGLLVREIGGPSMKVYQPKGVWESATSGRGVLARYVQDHGDNLYRRGLYSFIKRTVPPPGMLVFDASNRDQCEVNRLRTNTPLQALLVLNDPVILESARVFAERLMQSNSTVEEKINAAFRAIVCRMPKPEELKILMRYYADEKTVFAESPEKAKEFVNVGEYPFIDTRDKVSLAALMQVVHTIYNLEESITKV